MKNLAFFDTKWSDIYKKESSLLKSILEDNFIESHHIGSTAIRDIFSKPQIDIALIVKDLEKSKILEKEGYIFKGFLNIPFRYFFSKNTSSENNSSQEDSKKNNDYDIKFNIHVMLPDNPELENFLTFRDFLNKNENLRKEYSDLKLKIEYLIKNKNNDNNLAFNEYTLSKNDFITNVLKMAGFNGFCMRLVCHHLEKDHEKKVYKNFKEEDIRIVFYRGPNIIGYANIDKITKHINFFETQENENYFKDKLNDYLENFV